MTLPAGTRLGPYNILSPLGAGGMGEVYRARDTRLGRDVAVKVLPAAVSSDPERLKRFEKEARSASSLNHPNIVTVYDIGESGGTSFMAMELVEGVTLRELLADGALPTKRLLAIAAQTADGLAKAHAAGIVHRDLKPENVMITRDGYAKILDFGLAKLTQPEDTSGATQGPTMTAGTEPGVIMGTVGYMSPEQAVGHALDFRSDLFAFGSILYEMATGRRAFARASAPETLAAIIKEEPEALRTAAPAAPAPLTWFVERCLAKDPDERYASTRDLARDLARLRDGLSETSSADARAVAEPAPKRSRRWMAWTLAAVGVAAAIAVAATWRRVAEPPSYRALTFRRGSMGGARFGPDGQTVIYAAAWQGKPMQLYSTRANSTESSPMSLPSGDLLAVSSTGKMAIQFKRDEKVVVAETSLAGGAPRELFEGEVQVDYSPTEDRTVIARNGKLECPPGKVLYDPGEDRWIESPRFSPDGRWIAFIERVGPRTAIMIIDLAGKKRTLSDGWETTPSLAWHPQTGEVWFSAREFSGFGIVNLHAVSLSGRHRVVARGPLLLLIQDIARDGRVLLRADDWTETTMGLAPGAARETDLTWFDDSRVADLSSDGRRLLTTEGGIAERGERSHLPPQHRRLPCRAPGGRGGAGALAGREVGPREAQGEGKLVLLPTGPGEPKTIPTPGLEAQNAGWLPDGKRIYLPLGRSRAAARGSTSSTWPAAIRAPSRPRGSSGGSFHPTAGSSSAGATRALFCSRSKAASPSRFRVFRPDAATVRFDATGAGIFLAAMDVPMKIVRYDIASGRTEPWKEIAVTDPAGVVQFNKVVLTPDGKSYAYTFWRDLSRLYVVQGLK